MMPIPYIILNKNGIIILDEDKKYVLRGPLFSLRKYPKLRGKSLVIGYVGARGAGKSVNAARDIVINQLMRGKRVWSNMDVAFNLAVPGEDVVTVKTERFSKLSMQDLDLVYSDGCIYIDEINMEVAEARRSMDNKNLTINYIVQQLRKRRLNLVWSAQSEMHVDSRLRWQTDIFVKCVDKSKTNGPGELTELTCYDYSGVFHGSSPSSQADALIEKTTIANKPWWNMYDTWQMQGINEEEKAVNPKVGEAHIIAEEIKRYMETSKETRFLKRTLWEQWGIYGETEMMGMVGRHLRTIGVDAANKNSFYYVLDKGKAGVV